MHHHQLNVFVSSAMEELQFERESAVEVIRSLSHEPGLFELLPAMSDSPTRAYLDMVRASDIFVFLLFRRYSDASFDEYHEAVAQGKPIIVLVRASGERDDRLARFLAALEGRGEALPSMRLVYKRYDTLGSLRTELRQALAFEIGRMLRPPIHTLTREEMYELGAEIVRFAQRRLVIVQRTPSLFLGARPYRLPADQKWSYERRFLETLQAWIEAAAADAARSLIYAYSPADTTAHIARQDAEDRAAMTTWCQQWTTVYQRMEQESGRRLRFVPLRTAFSGPLAVGDNRLAIWLMGDDDAISIHQENKSVADVIVRMLKRQSHPNDVVTVAEDLMSA